MMQLLLIGCLYAILPFTLGTYPVNVTRMDNGLLVTRTNNVKLVSAYWRLFITIKPPTLHVVSNDSFHSVVAKTQVFVETECGREPFCPNTLKDHLIARLEDLKTLIVKEQIEHLHDHREKRGLFNAGGWLLGKLFGVATASDVSKLRDAVQDGIRQREALRHHVNELTSSYNQLAREANYTRTVLQKHNTVLAQMESDIEAIVSETNANLKRTQRNFKSILMLDLVSLVERRHQLLQDEVHRYRQQRMALEAGHLTESVLPRDDLKQIFRKVDASGYHHVPMDWYYEHSLIRPLWESAEGLSYIVELPMYKQEVTGYKIKTYPFMQSAGNWVRIVAEDYVGYDEQDGTMVKLKGCQGHYPTVCETDLIFRAGLPCERSLITGNSVGIRSCSVRIEIPKETIVDSVGINYHIVTTLDNSLETRCHGTPTRHPTIIHGSHMVEFVAGRCQLQGSSGWVLKSVDVNQEKLELRDAWVDMKRIEFPVIPELGMLNITLQHQLHQVEGIPIDLLKPMKPLHPLLQSSHASFNTYAVISVTGVILLCLLAAMVWLIRTGRVSTVCKKWSGCTCLGCGTCLKEKEEVNDSVSLSELHAHKSQVVPVPEIPETLTELREKYPNFNNNPVLPAYGPTYAVPYQGNVEERNIVTKF